MDVGGKVNQSGGANLQKTQPPISSGKKSSARDTSSYFSPQESHPLHIPDNQQPIQQTYIQQDGTSSNLSIINFEDGHGYSTDTHLCNFMQAILAPNYREIDINSYSGELIATIFAIKSVLMALIKINPYLTHIQQKIFFISKYANNKIFAKIEGDKIQIESVINNEDVVLVSPLNYEQVLSNLSEVCKNVTVQQKTLHPEIVKLLSVSKDYYANKIKSDTSLDIFKSRVAWVFIVAEIFEFIVYSLDSKGIKEAAFAYMAVGEIGVQILKKDGHNQDLYFISYNHIINGLKLYEEFYKNDMSEEYAYICIKAANLLKQLYLSAISCKTCDKNFLNKLINETSNGYEYGVDLYKQFINASMSSREKARIELIIADLKLEVEQLKGCLDKSATIDKIHALVDLYFDKAQKSITYKNLGGGVDHLSVVDCFRQVQNIYSNLVKSLPIVANINIFNRVMKEIKYISNFYIEKLNQPKIAAKIKFLFASMLFKKVDKYLQDLQYEGLTLNQLNHIIQLLKYAQVEGESGVLLLKHRVLSEKKLHTLDIINKKIQELEKIAIDNKENTFQTPNATWVKNISTLPESNLSEDLKNFLNDISNSQLVSTCNLRSYKSIAVIYSIKCAIEAIINQYKSSENYVNKKFLVYMYENIKFYIMIKNDEIQIKNSTQNLINLGDISGGSDILIKLEKFCVDNNIQRKLSQWKTRKLLSELAIFQLNNAIATCDVIQPVDVPIVYYNIGVRMLEGFMELKWNFLSFGQKEALAKKYVEAGAVILQLYLKPIRLLHTELLGSRDCASDVYEKISKYYSTLHSRALIEKYHVFIKYALNLHSQVELSNQLAITMSNSSEIYKNLAQLHLEIKNKFLLNQEIQCNYIADNYIVNRQKYFEMVKNFLKSGGEAIALYGQFNPQAAQESMNLFDQYIQELIGKCNCGENFDDPRGNFDDLALIYEALALWSNSDNRVADKLPHYLKSAVWSYGIHYEKTWQVYNGFLNSIEPKNHSNDLYYKLNMLYLIKERVGKDLIYSGLGMEINLTQISGWLNYLKNELSQIIGTLDIFDSVLVDMVITFSKEICAVYEQLCQGRLLVDMKFSIFSLLFSRVIQYDKNQLPELITLKLIQNKISDYFNYVKNELSPIIRTLDISDCVLVEMVIKFSKEICAVYEQLYEGQSVVDMRLFILSLLFSRVSEYNKNQSHKLITINMIQNIIKSLTSVQTEFEDAKKYLNANRETLEKVNKYIQRVKSQIARYSLKVKKFNGEVDA